MAGPAGSDRREARSVAPAERIVPLALKIGAVTIALLGLASVVVATKMATRERASLVEAKRHAAEQATELFATYDAAALEFADEAATREDVEGLARSRDVLSVAVFTMDRRPVAAVGEGAGTRAFPGARDESRLRADSIAIVRVIRALDESPLGVVEVRVSLRRENLAYEVIRRRIVTWVFAGAIGLALALAVALRWFVTQPLAHLVEATRRVQRGESFDYEARSRDEVGVLGRAFARMARTIAEREGSLREATERLQNVLDHMGQAILVFGADGTIDAERSREAAHLVGERERPIAEVLFPDESGGMIEREAFSAWFDAAFASSPDEFESLRELAPTEAVVPTDRGVRCYALDFRSVVHEGAIERIMVLATDVTEERALRADSARKEREHERRVAAMRRLVAGGGQVFVRFLEGARFRMATARARVGEITREDRAPVAELFRHVHTLRGEARCFDLDPVEALLAQVEFELSDLRVRRDERYDVDEALRTIGERLERVSAEIDAAERLFVEQSPVGAAILDQVTVRRTDLDALAGLARGQGEALALVARTLASRPFGESVFLVTESVPRWLDRAAKSARLEVVGKDAQVPPDLARLLPGVLAHLVRNAIAHGLETQDERVAAGKPGLGTITLECEPLDGDVRIRVRDDGRGFDAEGLRSRATEQGLATDGSLDSLVHHGVSTRASADELAGHGVGLGSVREELHEVGYRVRIESRPGHGSSLILEPTNTEGRST